GGSPLPRGAGPVDVGELREREEERVRPLLPAPLGLRRDVELLGEGEAGERELHALGLGEGDAEVLDEVVDLEAGLDVALEQARGEVAQAPRARGALADRVEDERGVEAAALRVEERLADRDHARGDRDLVDHLRVLAAARAAEEDDRLAEGLEERLRAVEA